MLGHQSGNSRTGGSAADHDYVSFGDHTYMIGGGIVNLLMDFDAENQRDLLSNAGRPQRGLRRFIATTASMRSFFGPFGPGRCLRSGENNKRYFRFLSRLWRWSKVEGFRTMAERRTRAGRMKRVHKPARIRSAARRLGARFRPRLRTSS